MVVLWSQKINGVRIYYSMQTLEVPSTFKIGKSPWNISKISNPNLLSTTPDGMLKMKYNVGKDGYESGAQIFCNPFGLLPAEEVTLSYDVFFSDEWDFIICGKLPGIGFGTRQGEHASGGEWDPQGKCGSFRIMWQDGTPKSALLKGYLYLGIPGGPRKAYAPQGPNFKKVGNDDDRTGYSVYYKKQPCFKVKKGVWNTVSFTVRMNTVGKADGYLRMQVNDVVREIDDIVWRTDERTLIQDVYWVSIFGGSGKKFAPRNPNAYSLYRNIRMSTPSSSSGDNADFMAWAEKAVSASPRLKEEPFEHVLSAANLPIPPGMFTEFGLWKGGDIRKLARRFEDRLIYGFDESIPSAPFDNVRLVKGKLEATLPKFIETQKSKKIAFVHIANGANVLRTLDDAGMLQDGTLLVFEEAFEHPGWERHDMKHFHEFLKASAWDVEWLGKQAGGKGVVCRLVRKRQVQFPPLPLDQKNTE